MANLGNLREVLSVGWTLVIQSGL